MFILRVSHKYNKILSKLHALCFAIKMVTRPGDIIFQCRTMTYNFH